MVFYLVQGGTLTGVVNWKQQLKGSQNGALDQLTCALKTFFLA